MTSIELKIMGFLGVLIVIGGFAGFFEHRGAKHVEDTDAVAVAKEDAIVKHEEASAQDTVKAESAKYDAQIAAPIINVPALTCVRVQTDRGPVLRTASAPFLGNGTTSLQPASGPSFNPAADLLTIGRDADSQIEELQSWIRDVALLQTKTR